MSATVPHFDSDILSNNTASFPDDEGLRPLQNSVVLAHIAFFDGTSVHVRVETMPRSSDVVNQALFVMDAPTASDPHGRHGCLEGGGTVSDVACDVNFPSRHRQNLTLNWHFSPTQATQKRDLSIRVTICERLSPAAVSSMKHEAFSVARKPYSLMSISFRDPILMEFEKFCSYCRE